MKIISFAWTIEPLLAGAKTVTRREWKEGFARQFRAGDQIAAYDKSPRAGGKQVATLRLVQSPYQEPMGSAPEADYVAEGLAWMAARGLLIDGQEPRVFWTGWKYRNPLVWVVRFEVVSRD